jgi:rhodanese-related sulfurtransferase
MQVATFLEHHGFENIINISGGINEWSNQVDASIPVY